jgi:sec-independent protein translocase protein TatA
MGGLSLMHWVVVLIVFLLLFGAGRVADLGKGLGEGIRNLKKGLAGDDDEKPKPEVKRELPQEAASTKPAKKVIQIEVAEGEDEAEALRKAAAEKAASKKRSDG